MSFEQGLSGLNAASKNLEVIGNNIANANTVGFKQSQAQFSDVFANALTGGGASQIGIGTRIAAVEQQFTEGNITSSNNPLDIAINGGGFFRMSDNGTITYSRNGQFQLDKLGYIVNAANNKLTGYTASSAGVLSAGSPVDLIINTADLAPKSTDSVVGLMNLDSRGTALSSAAFDPTDPTTYNNSTSVSVFDSLGNSHTLQTFFVKTSPISLTASTTNASTTMTVPSTAGMAVGMVVSGSGIPAGTTIASITNGTTLVLSAAATATGSASVTATTGAATWDVFTTVDGITPPLPATPATTMTFTGTGVAPTGATATISIPVATGATTPLSVNLDLSGSTQFGSNFSVNSLSQNGYTSGRLGGFDVSADGIIVGHYTNGQSQTLGQVVLANFVNPNGLQSVGSNAWTESATSGAPLVGTPNSGSLGVLQSSAVEDSNVDLTAELVNMITAQRAYQANAQTIKTQDQVMQTLVNLR